MIAANAGSTGTLNIGAGAGNPAAAPGTLTAPSVAFGAGTGTINFNHTSADYVFAPAISGNGTVNVLAGTTILTGANSYSGATNVNGGTLRAGALEHVQPAMSAATVARRRNARSQRLQPDRTNSLTNAGLVNMGTGAAPGTVLTTTSYTGAGGTMAINTVLGGDGSPSDTIGHQRRRGHRQHHSARDQCRWCGCGNDRQRHSGGERGQRGDDRSRAPSRLPAGELRAGAFDYALFRGGVWAQQPQ